MSSLNEIIQQLWKASDQKKECRVILEGEPFPRVIQPYGVCKTTANKIVLVCRQVSGYTKSGGSEGFRNLQLNKIKEVEILDKRFTISPDFDPEDGQYPEWVYHIG